MKKFGVLYSLMLLFCLHPLVAQEKSTSVKFAYDADFLFYFDNREFSQTKYQHDFTQFGVRLAPEVGISIQEDSGKVSHRVMVGVAYNQPIGTDYARAEFRPTAYYRLQVKGFDVNLGFVPYTHLIEDMPTYLWYDSLAYQCANIQGALFQYRSEKGFASVLADWRGMYGDSTREAFRVVISGRYQRKWFNIGGMAMINHLANSKTKNYGVCDDYLVNPYVGLDFTSYTPMDTLSLRAGYLFGIQRDRNRDENYFTHGGCIELFARWKYVGLKNTLYIGDNMFPLYSRYGAVLNQGDPWYRANIYNRTDILVYIFNNRFVNVHGAFTIDVTEEGKFNCQQQIIAQFNLGRVFDKKAPKLRAMLAR